MFTYSCISSVVLPLPALHRRARADGHDGWTKIRSTIPVNCALTRCGRELRTADCGTANLWRRTFTIGNIRNPKLYTVLPLYDLTIISITVCKLCFHNCIVLYIATFQNKKRLSLQCQLVCSRTRYLSTLRLTKLHSLPRDNHERIHI